MEPVRVSAYRMVRPDMWRAQRPIVWISEVALRKYPSLSASRIATRDTSGRSRPSRRRLMPMSTSNSPRRRSQNFDAVERFYFGMQVAAAHTDLREIFGEILGHTLGERGNENTLTTLGA